MTLLHATKMESEAMNLESSPIVIALIDFIEIRLNWEGTYQKLYDELTVHSRYGVSGWPKSAKGLAEALKRHDAYLSKVGIKIQRGQRTKQGYWIHVSMQKKP